METLGSESRRKKAIQQTFIPSPSPGSLGCVRAWPNLQLWGGPAQPLFHAPSTPSATTPTFFLCCESSKGCGRRVRRSQALKDGAQLLTGLQDMQEGMGSALSPFWLWRAPQACLDLPSPKQLGGGKEAMEPSQAGEVAPGRQGPATWPPHVPDSPVHSTFSLWASFPIPQMPSSRPCSRGHAPGETPTVPLPHLPPPSPSLRQEPNTPHTSIKTQAAKGYLILLLKKHREIHGPEVRQRAGMQEASPKPSDRKTSSRHMPEMQPAFQKPTLGASVSYSRGLQVERIS